MIAIAALAMVAGVVLFFVSLPRILVIDPQPRPAQVIIHNAIDPRSNSDQYIAGLYRNGVGKKVLCVSSQISWDIYPADYACRRLVELGVAREDAISLRLPIADCAAMHMAVIADHVKQEGWSSALIVLPPEASRSGDRLAKKIFGQRGIDVSVTYSNEDLHELTDNWWIEHWKVQRLVAEVMVVTVDLLYPECR